MELKDKLVVVTGGARRVGRAIVEALAGAGARPVIHYHDSRREALALAERLGGVAVGADLSLPDGAGRLCRQVLDLDGDLAVWVNNASAFRRADLLQGDDALWTETLQLGVLSPAACARLAAPAMVDGGVIVNVLDVAAAHPWRGYAHHCVAKAALEMLTRCLALELGPRLRACGVSPGLVLPGDQEPDQPRRRLLRRVPLEREGTPQDVARAVLFLADNDYITGSVVHVDGGLGAR